MKNYLIAFTAFLILMVAGAAFAQESNIMGLYFDPLGDVDCLDTNELIPFESFDMHLILKNPSFDGLFGFEAGFTGTGDYQVLSVVVHSAFDPYIGLFDNIIIGFGTPVVMEEINLLATYQAMYTGIPGGEVCFILHGSDPAQLDPLFPTLLTGEQELIAAAVNHGSDGTCTAILADGPCIVATTIHTWDSLKTLYR